MHEKILQLIQEMRLLSLAVCDDEGVYIANAFYVFDEKSLSFIIASDENSKHIQLAYKNPKIALCIAKDTQIALLKGLQIKAELSKASKEQKKLYLNTFPFARFAKTSFYALSITWAKLTDNTLLLSKKLEFKAEDFKK